MAEAARDALEQPTLNVVADAGYSNGAQAEALEAQGIVTHIPANRAVNNQGDGTFFDRTSFAYDAASDTLRGRFPAMGPADFLSSDPPEVGSRRSRRRRCFIDLCSGLQVSVL